MIFQTSHYKELMRLYPKIRIPYLDQAIYYLLELSLTDASIGEITADFQDCVKKHGDVTSYKMKKMDEILKYFKDDTDLMDNFNNATLPTQEDLKSPYPKSFGNWKPEAEKFYVSVDMNAANWSVFCENAKVPDKPKWIDFVTEKFDLHPCIAKSKSFRQFVLGNMNPRRQQSFQKAFMIELAGVYTAFGVPEPVMLSADEILFEIPSGMSYFCPKFDESKYGIKETTYCMEIHDSYGERVLVKRNLNTNHRELFSIQGTRFFIHYKNIILNKPVEDRDLYFEPEPKRLAKWVI